eukprot:m.78014 g.78014  ORF g.78014 m.78014 type:complete len:471 (+) comp14726_c0_seq1:36-1448(+)
MKIATRLLTAAERARRVCIVGAGPAGFYTAQHILKNSSDVRVDVLERLPVPYGLARFGVAPDHPDVKNCTDQFATTASNPRCRLLGNIHVGRDVRVGELMQAYDAVVLAYGAESDKPLGIPGESLKGVLSARAFVGWYNGLPDLQNLDVDLSRVKTCLIVGQGNVGLDVARIQLSPLGQLSGTDITQRALDTLRRSTVRDVVMVGRRGPLEVAFTIKEFREMTKLPGCRVVMRPEDFNFTQEERSYVTTNRPRKRLTELMEAQAQANTATNSTSASSSERTFRVLFNLSPVEVIPDKTDADRVGAVKFRCNRLDGPPGARVTVPLDAFVEIPCQMVLKSVGYQGVQIDPEVPFDKQRHIVPNENGKVVGAKNLYCSGWIKRGPTGIIATTMQDAFATAAAVLRDLPSAPLPGSPISIDDVITQRRLQPVSFEEWRRIEEAEKAEGAKLGKSCEKVTDVSRMLQLARGESK